MYQSVLLKGRAVGRGIAFTNLDSPSERWNALPLWNLSSDIRGSGAGGLGLRGPQRDSGSRSETYEIQFSVNSQGLIRRTRMSLGYRERFRRLSDTQQM